MWEMLHREKERTSQKAQERGQHRLPAAGSTKQIRPPARACRALPSSHSKNEEQPIRSSRPSRLNEETMHARKRDPSTLQLQLGTNENGPIIKELHERQKIWTMHSRSNKLELAMHSVIKTEGGSWLYNSSHNWSHAFSPWPCI
ncbi:hypothetical protein NC653_015144 [Populus alba x Populus x berolinensis]|uniref:Uncharacterized protein n=1 Tax=Populus alba x Populus x berolinensis TaxID=444605 RepID=A0AAD6W4N2_9ROSI|nr:hypothetical protein NC653_015144 [Populus alba x Populus x berolinensis]